MYLSKILLQNFRSHEQKLIEFDPKTNLIIGPNGSGKTNILEAIFLLASGKSFRSSSLSKLVFWNKNFSCVRAKLINDKKEEIEIEVQLVRNLEKNLTTVSKKFLIQKVEKTRKKYLGVLKTVVFEPDDIRLISGSPTRRRDFIDNIFSQTEWRYAAALSQFNKALKHRNELLDLIKIGKNSKNELFFWDQSLIKNSQIIHQFRISFFKNANLFFSNHENPEIKDLFLEYHPSILNQEKLDKNYFYDLERGYTQAGIHRDDFTFNNSIFASLDKNLAFWGSRGQQRLAVLALRLAQIDFLEKQYQDRPILLLDDIFSELDSEHQHLVSKICRNYQTIFTSPNIEISSFLSDTKVIELDSFA